MTGSGWEMRNERKASWFLLFMVNTKLAQQLRDLCLKLLHSFKVINGFIALSFVN